MNRKIIIYLIGKLLLVEALLLLAPLFVSLIYQEDWKYISAYLMTIGLLLSLSCIMSLKNPKGITLRARDGAVIVALGWILLAFFGGLPFVFSGDIPSLVDAFFETASGFTTTGSSILTTLAPLSKSNLFWRSFTHLIGGMGVLVFTLAILPDSKADSAQLLRAEVPGPVFGKLVSKLSDTARILYAIYLSLTLILILILVLGGVPLYDSMLLSFGTAGTGGFAINDAGFSIYANPAFVEYVIGIGMLIFGINFNLFFLMMIGYAKAAFKDEELHYYLGIVIIAILLITLSLAPNWATLEETFRHVLFTVASIVTTTGYATANFGEWTLFAQVIVLILMFIGGCAGSTAGGMKVSRIVMYIKEAVSEMKRLGHSNRIVTTKFNGKALRKSDSTKVSNYLQIYLLTFILLLICVSIEAPDFLTAFSSVAATFNNIGPGLAAVGPISNFAFYSDMTKIILSLSMIAGRLEIYPIIILLAPSTLKKLFKGNKAH
ncbi:TrkH family potassium uptake protein [Granulicatella sp. zg-ZJ]|uniref:TrkH family potassium uptake protein n=1 Tax=unclassified Granulicatella TaxID=2630493 RepID=UPI0013C05927|nr:MULTISPECIES: TrkH family potassium uptake protein [unclassified Granulicatella]NEW62133.1 TrkH family potassium uptake protein [Granulicatella sp. zg-ZJ]NEW66918.1 TrkH family potassium uptake protein [Granulicatella sp. zg-84]QMI86237.1 TrkH family potassium uptake protein [Carnobacteriaceae bacterium zg-84]